MPKELKPKDAQVKSSNVLITPPMPEELWYRVREFQTKKATGQLVINWAGGRVLSWQVVLDEESVSGRHDIRLQATSKPQK